MSGGISDLPYDILQSILTTFRGDSRTLFLVWWCLEVGEGSVNAGDREEGSLLMLPRGFVSGSVSGIRGEGLVFGMR